MRNRKVCALLLVFYSFAGGGCVEAARDGVTGGVKSGIASAIESVFQIVLDAMTNSA